MPQLILTFVLIAIGWFLIVRPQQARVKGHQQLVANLEAGDRIITAGGIHGEITEVSEETVLVRVAPDLVLTLARGAVGRKIDPEPAPSAGPEDTVNLDLERGEGNGEERP